jgi:hypothetical protein
MSLDGEDYFIKAKKNSFCKRARDFYEQIAECLCAKIVHRPLSNHPTLIRRIHRRMRATLADTIQARQNPFGRCAAWAANRKDIREQFALEVRSQRLWQFR